MIFKSEKQIAKEEAVDIWERILQYAKDNKIVVQNTTLFGIKQSALKNTKYADYISLCSYCDNVASQKFSVGCEDCIGVHENAFTPHGDKCWSRPSTYFELLKLLEKENTQDEYETALAGIEALLMEFKRIADNKPKPLLNRFIKLFKIS